MSKPRVEYEIGSKDKSQKGLKDAESGLSKFKSAAAASFKAVGVAAAAATAAMATIGAAANKLLDVYGDQEQAEIKLAAAARNNPLIDGTAYQGLLDSAAALQEVSIYGDEAIIPLQALGVSMGYTQDQINNVSQAAADLASATGMSLESAFRNLYKSLGGVGGELGELIPSVRGLTEEQLRAGAAIEVVNEQFGGMAEAVAGSVSGIREQMKNLFGDFLENLGEGLAPAFRAITQKIRPWLEHITELVAANADKIANFFLYLPEIARVGFNAIMQSLRTIFTLDYIKRLMTSMATYIWNVVKALIPLLWSYLKRYWESIFILGRNVIQSLWEVIRRVGQTIWAPITFGFEYAVYGIKIAWRETMQFFSRLIDGLVEGPVNWIGKAFHTMIQGIKVGFEAVINGIVTGLNFVLRPLDRILFLIGQIDEHGMRFRQYDEYIPGTGMGGVQIGRVDFDTTEWEDLSSDLADRWEYAISPPDRNLGAEIASVWEEFWPDFTEPWQNFGEQMAEVWDGFGVDLRTFSDEAREAIGEYVSVLAEPWSDSFAEARANLQAILSRELPPELQSTVNTIIDSLDDAAETAAETVAANVVASSERFMYDFQDSNRESLSMWGLFNLYLRDQAGQLRENLRNFVGRIVDGGSEVIDGFRRAGDWIVRAIEDPQEAIAEAGFALARTINAIKANSEEIKGKIVEGLGSAAAFAGQILLAVGQKILDLLQSTEIFQDTMQILNDAFISLANGLLKPLLDTIRPLIDIIVSLATTMADALNPIMQALVPVIEALLPLVEPLRSLIASLGQALLTLVPIIQIIVNALVQALIPVIQMVTDILGVLGEFISNITPIIDALVNIIMSVLNPVLSALGSILETIYPVFDLIAQLLLILAPVLDGLSVLLESILTPVIMFLTDLIGAVLTPVITILTGVLQVLTPIFKIIGVLLKALAPLFDILGQLLMLTLAPLQILGVLVEALAPLFNILAQVLEFLIPVFDFLAKVIDAVTRPIEFLADALNWIVEVFKAVGHNIISFIVNLLSFGTANREYVAIPSFSSDAFSRPLVETTPPGVSPSPDTAPLPTTDDLGVGDAFAGGSPAQYGGTNLTVNVYIEAEAIVGEPGLREFAVMINNEIEDARNLGIIA